MLATFDRFAPIPFRDPRRPLHSITSSARARSVGGTVMPSALAALRFNIVSYLVGTCVGRSAGLARADTINKRGRLPIQVDEVGPVEH